MKITRSGCMPVTCAPSSSPIRSRASSSTRRARRPNCVLAGRIQARLGPARAHCFGDFRQNRRRGVMVEIDRLDGMTCLNHSDGSLEARRARKRRWHASRDRVQICHCGRKTPRVRFAARMPRCRQRPWRSRSQLPPHAWDHSCKTGEPSNAMVQHDFRADRDGGRGRDRRQRMAALWAVERSR